MRLENKQGLGLTGFYSNSNGHGKNVSGLIKFSKYSWFMFSTIKEAICFINRMKKEINEIEVIKEKWPGDITAIRQKNNIERAKKIISQLVIK